MIDRDALRGALDGILREQSASTTSGWSPSALDGWADAILALDRPDPSRRWIGEARAAFDQSLQSLGGREGQDAFGDPAFWVSRAQAAAAIASAEQSRLANLIAWKQVQATRSSSGDLGVALMPLADAIGDEIEEGLGIA